MEMEKITVPEKVVAFSSGLVEWATGYVINSDESNVEVVDKLKRIKNAIADIKKEEKRHTKPLNDLKQGYIDDYKPIYVPFEEAKKILEKKVLDRYHIKQEEAAKEQVRLRREETLKQKKLDEETAELAKKGIKLNMPEQEKSLPPTVAAPEKTVKGVYGTMSIPTKPAFKLIDISKVPVKYLVLNEPKVNEAARQGIKEISGMQWYEKESVANR